jgi:hypothetical protein
MPLNRPDPLFQRADSSGDSTSTWKAKRALRPGIAGCMAGLAVSADCRFARGAHRRPQAILVRSARMARRLAARKPMPCESAGSVMHFDRLCRTLHALNFLAQRQHAGGYLQLAVHPRHLLAVPSQHGLVYEAILKRCGLAPEDTMKIANNVTELVGNTPLVKLNRITAGSAPPSPPSWSSSTRRTASRTASPSR